MTYRSRPLFRRPGTWRSLAFAQLVFAVLQGARAVYGTIYEGPVLWNLFLAAVSSLAALFALAHANRLEREED